ncbi:MAG: LamB/YcsF family protein, partial [Acidiferrobacterales bacterium]|nr:LamB/YcsF family protein [Acidiferrobacterales bacterium]
TELAYVKPHGALYNDITERPKLFELMLNLISKITIQRSLMLSAGLPSQSLAKAERAGVTIIREAFADRQYLSDFQLMPRSQEGAVFNSVEQICCQVRGLKTGIVKDENGNSLSLQAQSICIHGDNPASIDAIVPITQILNS